MTKKNMSETEQKIVENLLDEMYKSFDMVNVFLIIKLIKNF
jgi:hypothetical protein